MRRTMERNNCKEMLLHLIVNVSLVDALLDSLEANYYNLEAR